MRDGRLIPLERLDAAANMAADQSMLESVDDGGPPTLRFYQWSEPTLSLGYFQSINDRDLHAQSRNAACVRRASGGGAIVHHHELTYSLAWPIEPSVRGFNLVLYRKVRDAIVAGLAKCGIHSEPFAQIATSSVVPVDHKDAASVTPFLCFQRRTADDLIVGGYKVMGSAQRKGRQSVLQHGSLLLAASPLAPELPGLCELGATRIDGLLIKTDLAVARMAETLTHSFADGLGAVWTPGDWTSNELSRRTFWQQSRFGDASWLSRR